MSNDTSAVSSKPISFDVSEAWPTPYLSDTGRFTIDLTPAELDNFKRVEKEYSTWVARFNMVYNKAAADLIAEAVAAERAECASLCDHAESIQVSHAKAEMARANAFAIRARGEARP